MNEKDRYGPASSEESQSQEGDESIDSLMRAVARVGTVERLSHRSTLPSPEPRHGEEAQATPPPLPRVGDVLAARYELTEMLGAGGMGAVFAARHKGTGREVAIKVLLPHQGSLRTRNERISRFVREARAAGRIKHPNVVDIYDVDGDSETPYIVMERLHGESMWQRIKRGALPAEEAVRVLVAAMHGVAEVHRMGVIHRDLKPDNIFLANAPNGGPPVPKVLDFGVSRIVVREGIEPRPTTLTRAGYILGTPSYMPLEQLRGEPDVDARADVYALGVILYEALCGARPYEARNDHELVIRMATEAPTPLAQKVPNIERSLAVIVIKALAREADERFQDVESFAAALERWLAGERSLDTVRSDPTRPDLHISQLTKGKFRDPRKVWAAVLALMLVAISAAYVVVARRDDVAERLAPVRETSVPAVQPATSAPAPVPTPEKPASLPELAAEPAPEVATEPARDQPVRRPSPAAVRGTVRGAPSTTAKPRTAAKPAAETPPEAAGDDRATKLNPEDF